MKRAALAVGLLALPAVAGADQVFLVGGGKLSGVVVMHDQKMVVLETGPGRVSVPASRVLRVERSEGPLATYRDRAARLAADDVAGWLELGLWAREQHLLTQSREALSQVLRIEPNHAIANEALDNVRMNGQWMSRDQSFRERGFVFFEGEWVSPAEREAIVQTRVAEAAADTARREGELRVREAEARARQAEAEARRVEAEEKAQDDGGIPFPWVWGTGFGGVIVDRPHANRPPRPRHPQPVASPSPPAPPPPRPDPPEPPRARRPSGALPVRPMHP